MGAYLLVHCHSVPLMHSALKDEKQNLLTPAVWMLSLEDSSLVSSLEDSNFQDSHSSFSCDIDRILCFQTCLWRPYKVLISGVLYSHNLLNQNFPVIC